MHGIAYFLISNVSMCMFGLLLRVETSEKKAQSFVCRLFVECYFYHHFADDKWGGVLRHHIINRLFTDAENGICLF